MSLSLPRFSRNELLSPEETTISALRALSRTCGAFCLERAVDSAVMEAAFVASRRFFNLPLAEKMRISAEASEGIRGYRPLPTSAAGDLKEWFFFIDGLPEDPENKTAMPGRNVWPEVPEFREALVRAAKELHEAGQIGLRALAKAVGLPAESFSSLVGRGLRVLRYPAEEERHSEGQWGAEEHTDMTPFAVIAEDQSGLFCQMEDGSFSLADVEKGAVLCQTGDLLARWTGDAIRPSRHRVALSRGKERISLCLFLLADVEEIIPCLETNLGTFRAHEPITFGTYMNECAEAVRSRDA